jgi:tryptophan-rich sensory protein
VIARLRQFGAFWYDFVIGDDWQVAAGVVIALAATYVLHRAAVPAWWVLPVAVLLLLPYSLWRATKPKRPDAD